MVAVKMQHAHTSGWSMYPRLLHTCVYCHCQVALYVERSALLWKAPDALELLRAAAVAAADVADGGSRRTGEAEPRPPSLFYVNTPVGLAFTLCLANARATMRIHASLKINVDAHECASILFFLILILLLLLPPPVCSGLISLPLSGHSPAHILPVVVHKAATSCSCCRLCQQA